jgi:hypothetical protein
MTQVEFNEKIVQLLIELAELYGLRRSDPEHGTEGNKLMDELHQLSINKPESFGSDF